MNYKDLDKNLKQDNLNNIYVFTGDEKYLIDSYEKKLKNVFEKKYSKLQDGINYVKINEDTLKNLESELNMPSFGFDKKLVVIKNINIFKIIDEKTLKMLEEFSKQKDSLSILLIIEDKLDKRLASYKKIAKFSAAFSFDELKYDEISSYLAKYFKVNKASIEPGIIEYLVQRVGTSMLDIIGSCDKLIIYANGDKITLQTIDKLIPKKIDVMIFDLSNAIQNNLPNEKIEEIYNDLIESREPLQLILITLYNHFKRIYKTKIALQDNENIAKLLNLKQNQYFLVEKYIKIASSKSMKYWKNIINYLQDLDYNYKMGNIDLKIGLDVFIYKYCMKN